MHPKKWLLLLINMIGGAAVLGSYVLGILNHPNAGQVLWGDVPESIRPYYTTNMFLAAIGYFAFIFFILFRLDPVKTRVAGRFGFGLFSVLFAGILIPSALWMPLTFLAVEQSSLVLVWAVRIVLGLVGIASLALFYAILKVEPRQPLWAQRLALVGSIAFCLQTVFLDAIVWVVFFRI
jgi:hypothetical protein